jgi:hypothetical protein
VFAYFNRLLDDGDHLAEPLAAPPPRNYRGRGRHGLTEAEILELGDGPDDGGASLILLPSRVPPAPCPVCDMGGGRHTDECARASA